MYIWKELLWAASLSRPPCRGWWPEADHYSPCRRREFFKINKYRYSFYRQTEAKERLNAIFFVRSNIYKRQIKKQILKKIVKYGWKSTFYQSWCRSRSHRKKIEPVKNGPASQHWWWVQRTPKCTLTEWTPGELGWCLRWLLTTFVGWPPWQGHGRPQSAPSQPDSGRRQTTGSHRSGQGRSSWPPAEVRPRLCPLRQPRWVMGLLDDWVVLAAALAAVVVELPLPSVNQ